MQHDLDALQYSAQSRNFLQNPQLLLLTLDVADDNPHCVSYRNSLLLAIVKACSPRRNWLVLQEHVWHFYNRALYMLKCCIEIVWHTVPAYNYA